MPVTQQLENLHADDSPPPELIENTAEDYEIMKIHLEAAAADDQAKRSATNNHESNDAPLSPPAIEYLSDDETLQDENTDELVCFSLSPARATHDASSPPPIQSDTSSDISSTPPSYSHLIPRGESPPLGALDDLSNVGYIPNPSALQIKIINHRLAHPPSYLKCIIKVTLRRSMGKALANLVPLTAIRFGSRVSPRSTTKWAELIPLSQFQQLFPGINDYAHLEQFISTRRADYGRIPNRWQSQLTRIRRLRHLVYRVIQDAEHLVTNYGFPYGLRDFAVGLEYWQAGLTTNGLLYSHEARYLFVLDIFLTQVGIIDLAANARQILYARFDHPRDLWTLVDRVLINLDPPANHFDLDTPPAGARRNSTKAFQPAELDEPEAVVA